jgi:hypothetical protein
MRHAQGARVLLVKAHTFEGRTYTAGIRGTVCGQDRRKVPRQQHGAIDEKAHCVMFDGETSAAWTPSGALVPTLP